MTTIRKDQDVSYHLRINGRDEVVTGSWSQWFTEGHEDQDPVRTWADLYAEPSGAAAFGPSLNGALQDIARSIRQADRKAEMKGWTTVRPDWLSDWNSYGWAHSKRTGTNVIVSRRSFDEGYLDWDEVDYWWSESIKEPSGPSKEVKL